MNYYKDSKNKVYAYSDDQLSIVNRISELSELISELEPEFNSKLASLNAVSEVLESARNNEDNIEIAERNYNVALSEFNGIDSKYQPLVNEYNSISPVFFEIQLELKSLIKMSKKEIESHINPKPTKEQLVLKAESDKASLIAEATIKISPLQDAVDIGNATDSEISMLRSWKEYRVNVNRVDSSLAPDIEWPQKPE
ncbi:tail fiber assembly protein [Proteus mirabilis]|uniref:tail fiber assembly protein n=1 Tax=Proteus mirabilis TaxID=584 RepID=UPI0023615FA0|nr:tail fiber assembly protein [Proteus mirabilis]MDC9748664.1 tail fiber assembly protein [Proteus mirabilis]